MRKPGYLVGTACAVAGNAPATVRLARGASITGTVVTPAGAPVAGVTVLARPPRGLPEVPGRVETATSDAEGRFVVEGLLREAFDLTFRHPAYFDEAQAEVAAGTRDLSRGDAARVRGHVPDDDRRPDDAGDTDGRVAPRRRRPRGDRDAPTGRGEAHSTGVGTAGGRRRLGDHGGRAPADRRRPPRPARSSTHR